VDPAEPVLHYPAPSETDDASKDLVLLTTMIFCLILLKTHLLATFYLFDAEYFTS
jgi:hypothetical protein